MIIARMLFVALLVLAATPPVASLAQAPAAAPAASPETMRLAKEYYDVAQKDTVLQSAQQSFDGMMKMLNPEVRAMFDDAALAELRQTYGTILTKFAAVVAEKAPDIYARRFTADELRELIRFYKTPVGQKLLKETPAISAETLTIMAPHAQEMQQQIVVAMETALKSSKSRAK